MIDRIIIHDEINGNRASHSREPRIESGAGARIQKETGFRVKPGMTNRRKFMSPYVIE